MPHFDHQSRRYSISTNFKVMFSTLRNHPKLAPLGIGKFQRRQLHDRICPWLARKSYLIVRHPHRRIESFFKDKFRQFPQNASFQPEFKWQHCQRIFFPYLNLAEDAPHEVVRKRLMATRFEEVISFLPHVYQLDGHLHPQCQIQECSVSFLKRKFRYRAAFTRVFRMEDRTSLHALNQIGIDTNVKLNATPVNTHYGFGWCPTTRDIVDRLYRADFREFAY